MLEVKPYKEFGATNWAVYKNDCPLYTGLTREQAEQIKEKILSKHKKWKMVNAKTKIFI